MAQTNEGGYTSAPPKPQQPAPPPRWTTQPPKPNRKDRTKDETPGGPGVPPVGAQAASEAVFQARKKQAQQAAQQMATGVLPPWLLNAMAGQSQQTAQTAQNWAPVPFATPTMPAWTQPIPGMNEAKQKQQNQNYPALNYSLLAGNNPWSSPASLPQWQQFNSELGYGSQVFPLSSASAGAAPFTFFQNTPLGWNTKTTTTTKAAGAAGGGWGKRRGGGGGGWSNGGWTNYNSPASAWASLVGWNINR